METIIGILILFAFVMSVLINLFYYFEVKELKDKLEINNNSFFIRMKSEAKMKRIYKTLYNKVIKTKGE